MIKKISFSQDHKALIRRYLLWAFKTTKESFERVERKTTQLLVDEDILGRLKKTKVADIPITSRKEYDRLIEEFKVYIKTKKADELKLKFSDGQSKTLGAQYLYLKNRLKAIEAAIVYFLGAGALRAMRALYEKEFTLRILQAREHG